MAAVSFLSCIMKVLLLGANGLLGHNVLHLLLMQGHEVFALVRRPDAIDMSAVPVDKADSFSVHVGNILDFAFLMKEAEQCQAIINCAGVTDMSLLHYEDYLAINRNLCQLLVDVVLQSSVVTLVHVSTANTIGCGTSECMADESFPPQSPFSDSFYAKSKMEGENIVLQTAKDSVARGKRFIVLNPGFMVGAFDTKPSSGRLLLAAYRLPLMFVPSGGKGFVPVRSVAVAAVNALEIGMSGRRYLLVSDNLSLKDFYRLQAHVCGYRQILISLPRWLLKAVGWAGDVLRRMGVRTQVSSVNIAQLMASEHYDSSAARAELSMPGISVEDAISEFFLWRKKSK